MSYQEKRSKGRPIKPQIERPVTRRFTPNPDGTTLKPGRPGLWIAGIAVFGISTYASFNYTKVTAEPLPTVLHIPEDVSDKYNQIAKSFDSEVSASEMWMGLGWLRSWLVAKASGNVLEVSVGTGRNTTYYDVERCKSISMLDQSQEMMDITRMKFKREHPRPLMSSTQRRLLI